MNKQEYEQKRSTCWGEFCANHPINVTATGYYIFRFAFDSGYEFSKQAGSSEQPNAGEGMISGWVARDKNNSLYLYEKRPVRDHNEWVEETIIYLDDDLFPDITWESDPEEVEIIIKRKKEEWIRHYKTSHGVASKAEGEEMLTVSRKQVQSIYCDNCVEIHSACVSSSDKDCYQAINEVLKTLFGPKCYLDADEDNFTTKEPKFKEGNWVKATCGCDKSFIGQIIATRIADDGIFYQIEGAEEWLFLEKNVEPYNELISQKWPKNCDTESHISTGINTSHETAVCENHSGDTSQESEVLMKITSRSPITISIIQVKDKGATV